MLVLGLAAWSSSGTYEALLPVSTLHTSRSYAIHYVVLTKPDPITGTPARARRSTSDREAAGRTTPRASPAAEPTTSAGPAGPTGNPEPAPQPPAASGAQELLPGEVAGIGQVESAPGTASQAATGLLDKLGFRPPTPEELGSAKRGDDRVAELVTGTSSACPEFEPPAGWPRPTLAVSVAFVVDTNGVVDRGSLRVVESPAHPQSDRRYHAHVYVVAATMRADAGSIDPVRYDSLVTREMTSHAADLTFRPALEDGQPVRSSVLISCQILQPG